MFDVVVNYFNRSDLPPQVYHSLLLSALCYRSEPEVSKVIVVDGSQLISDELKDWCLAHGIIYVHSQGGSTFPESLNIGISMCSEDWVLLSASDIYIKPGFLEKVNNQIALLDLARIGCIVPTLNECDLPSQTRISDKPVRTGLMTLNLNILPLRVIRLLGGVSEEFSGNYNDVELCLGIQQLGLDIYRVPVQALHFGRMTIGNGSTICLSSDKTLFFAKHPELHDSNSLWSISIPAFYSGWRKLFYSVLFRSRVLKSFPRLQSFVLYFTG